MSTTAEIHVYLYGPNLGPLNASFEQSESRLVKLPGLHFEPDGSFAWAIDSGPQRLFGMIYDAAGRIQYCELRGCCDLGSWQMLCQAITGNPATALEILSLPNRQRQNLQSFEQANWQSA